jgi:hypothetical protein
VHGACLLVFVVDVMRSGVYLCGQAGCDDVFRCETGEGDAVSSSKSAEAGRKSGMETRGHRATRGAALPERGGEVESY